MSIARNNRRMSSSLYGVAWAALLSLLLPFAVWADDEEGEIEEIVVTGSLIKRDNFHIGVRKIYRIFFTLEEFNNLFLSKFNLGISLF